MSTFEKVELLINCKYIGSTSTVNNVATKSMGLPLVFSWFAGPIKKKRGAAGAGPEGSSAVSIFEDKWDNASGTTP